VPQDVDCHHAENTRRESAATVAEADEGQ